MTVFITLVASLLLGLPSVASEQNPASVEDLAWLAGCWASVGGEAGGLAYVAKPSGQTEATFLMVRLSEGEVVFENLEARIEGEVKGEVRTVDFPMKRVDCTSATPNA